MRQPYAANSVYIPPEIRTARWGLTEQPIRRGDSWWRQRDDGSWEVWSPDDKTWRVALGSPPGGVRPPPPPPPPQRPPLSQEALASQSTDLDAHEGDDRRRARTILVVVGILGAIVGAVWIGGRDWLFGSDETPPEDRAAVACGGPPPPSRRLLQFQRPPAMSLEANVDYSAIIRTSCGDMQVDLLEDKAPIAVNNFVFLAQNGFYDGLLWHHVTPNFIIQTGDPNGRNADPPDGPGYTIEDELPKEHDAYTFGKVAFANTGDANSSGSQFFIVVHDLAGALQGEPAPLEIAPTYTIFGRVPKRFFGSIQEIAQQPTLGGTHPLEGVRPRVPVYLNSIEIIARRR
jgi:cyclophilin family peptidyl-prolyl cis-trans isomerase